MKLTKDALRESLERIARREGWKIVPSVKCDWCGEMFAPVSETSHCGLCPDCRHRDVETVN